MLHNVTQSKKKKSVTQCFNVILFSIYLTLPINFDRGDSFDGLKITNVCHFIKTY